MLTSIESRTTVWSAGRARVGADVAALGAAITEAAAEMVRLTSGSVGDGEMDDLLVTSPVNFHVLRVVDGQVAHLVLDRGSANLAMARREFREMVAARSAPAELPGAVEAGPVGASADEVAAVEASVEASVGMEAGAVVARAVAPDPGVFVPEQRDDGPYPVGEAIEGEVLPASTTDPDRSDGDLPRLPQRRADAAWQDDPTAYQATVPALPGWLRAAAEGPFMNDLQTLDRVVGGLRRLP
jgi:hypothetical protein